ncbi:MAG: FAD-dependent monooxygenase, partial [Ktedonobacteraceae bacterium]|nr:FAD-dependent monooxygenase [Ktedonobacteraceae bacterium]
MSMHSALPSKASVVIIGAGPTGLTAANLLGLAGIETLVIEHNADICDFPRAISIDDEGLRIFQAMGLLEEILAHVRLNVQAQYISRGHFLARVAPEEFRNGFPLISTFHQPTLERILLKGLERFSCVKVYFQHTLEAFKQDEQGVHISVHTPTGLQASLECAYLLACDGGKSSVRRILGIPMYPPSRSSSGVYDGQELRGRRQRSSSGSTTGEQKWLVVDGIGERESSTPILFFCNPERPAVSVPGPDTHRRWEFMLLPGECEEDLLRTDTIWQLITQALRNSPHTSYSSSIQATPPLQIRRQTIYTFHTLIATKFFQGRTFLLGDAAHLMPPFGGQGMNSGLRDAHNLCWKLQLVLQNGVDATLLESYQAERYPHVIQMIQFSSFLGKVIMTTRPSIALLRDLFFRSLDKLAPARETLTEMRIKPQPRYTHGLLLKNSASEARKLVGALFPQPYILTPEGKRVLLDEALGNHFALIRLYEGHDPFNGLKHPLWS